MDTFEAIYQRRAVKHYDPTHEFTDAEINKLMEAAIQSPSSFNIQNWRFVLVRDKELRNGGKGDILLFAPTFRLRGRPMRQKQNVPFSVPRIWTSDKGEPSARIALTSPKS